MSPSENIPPLSHRRGATPRLYRNPSSTRFRREELGEGRLISRRGPLPGVGGLARLMYTRGECEFGAILQRAINSCLFYITLLDTVSLLGVRFVDDGMNLAEIVEASGLPARTIRFYIARGLLNGPVKAGRDAEYTAGHVAHLGRIKKLQSEGHTLSQIARILGGGAAASAVSRPTAWWQHTIADDVVVWVRGDASPWRMKQIHGAIESLARRVQTGNSRPERNKGTK